MADLIAPTSGRISVLGGAPQAAREARQIGFVFQDPALLAWRTVLENVSLPLEVGGGKALPGARAPRELLSLVGLDGWEKAYPHELSGGMRQRVAIARALVSRPAAPADGRAVRRARRDHARPAERGAAAALGDDRHDHRVRHALDLRGGLPRPERAAAGGAAGPGAREVPVDLPKPRRLAQRETPEFARSPAICAACWKPADGRAGRTAAGRVCRGRRGRAPATPRPQALPRLAPPPAAARAHPLFLLLVVAGGVQFEVRPFIAPSPVAVATVLVERAAS